MKNSSFVEPPFLVFPDQQGGFLLFHRPLAVFPGPQLQQAEGLASERQGWLAGGLEYGAAERAGPGWWGVFEVPLSVGRADLALLAETSPVFTGPLKPEIPFDDYRKSFDLVREALAAGTSYQVNLTFFLEGRVTSGSPWSWRSALRLWLDLIDKQGKEASFAVLGEGEHPGLILVSASPELFFSRQGNLLEARPMKGTLPRHADPQRDAALRHELETSTKNRAENLMVTDMLRNDLGRVAVRGGVSVPRLFEVEAFPTVWQMTSTVRAEVSPDLALTEVMSALFPCASITGAPKASTQAVIEKTEGRPRGWYTGTLGWHKPGSPLSGPVQSRFAVLIRTLVFEGGSSAFRLGVGGGVVWDSSAAEEWSEAWLKSRFLDTTRREFALTEAVLWEPETGFFLLREHEARLSAACRDFGGRLEARAFQKAVEDSVAGWPPQYGPAKLRVLADADFTLRVEVEPLAPLPEVLTAALSPRPLTPDTLLWRRYKTTDRRVYEENRAAGVDQTLFYNEKGELTESTSMTLVLERDGHFLTPALACGLLDGTFRAHLIAEGKLEEAVLPVEALATADKIWLINSVRRWKAVRLTGPLGLDRE